MSAGRTVAVLLFCFACLASGCRKGPALGLGVGGQAGDEASARALLSEFLKPGADHAALTRRLRPAAGDFAAAFEPAFAKKAEAGYAPAWEGGQIVVAPKAGQTQVLLVAATTEELKQWAGNAAEHFPGGYREVAHDFKPGLTVYAFKFVKAGESRGMAYDGLVHVNGNWRLFPKPFRLAK